MIRFGIRSHFLPNDASSTDFRFDQEVFLNHDILRFLLSNRSKIDWKVKRLHDRMPRLDIQVQFCEIFWQHFFFYFQKTYNLCKQGFSPQILNFALCEEMFGGRNCRDFRFCFTIARFRNCFLKLTAASLQPVCRVTNFAWRLLFKFFGSVLSLETDLTEVNLEYIEFWFFSIFPTFLQNLRLCIFDQCDNQHLLLATKSLLKNLTANGICFMNWETKWLKILKIKQSYVGFHYKIGHIWTILTFCTSKPLFQFIFQKKNTLCFSWYNLRMILFDFRTLSVHNHTSSSGFHADWKITFNW